MAVNQAEIQYLKDYFSEEEQEMMKKEREYMMTGPGKVQRILNEEMQRL